MSLSKLNVIIAFEDLDKHAIGININELIEKACQIAYTEADIPNIIENSVTPSSVNIVIGDDLLLKDLNNTYRGKNKPTNVLSFPSHELDENEDGPFRELGDIIVSYETLQKEAQEQHKPLHDHMAHMIVHGMLHILGYDHDNEKNALDMESKEVEILEKINVKNPYI